MKRTLAIAAAAMMLAIAAQAQNTDQQNRPQGERQRPDEATMIQNHTNRMVQKYGLNETQAASLLALNQKYSGKIGGPGMGPGHGPGMGPGRGGQKPETVEGQNETKQTTETTSTASKKAKKSKKSSSETAAAQTEKAQNTTAQQGRQGGQRPELTEEQKAKMEAHMAEMKANREAYNAELQKILTADQYKAYQEDMQRGPQGGHGPHGGYGPQGGQYGNRTQNSQTNE